MPFFFVQTQRMFEGAIVLLLHARYGDLECMKAKDGR
jgi:hypothetical protein